MNSKTMYALVAVLVVVVVVAGVAIYVFMGSGGDGNGNGNGNGEDVYTVANATSLRYEANVTSQGFTIPYKLAGKGLNTNTMIIRIDLLGGESGNYSYILNAGNQTAWAAVNDEWTDVSSDFTAQWNSWGTAWTGYIDELKDNWSGTGDYTYTADNGDIIKIFNVSINPTLPDSLFQPS